MYQAMIFWDLGKRGKDSLLKNSGALCYNQKVQAFFFFFILIVLL